MKLEPPLSGSPIRVPFLQLCPKRVCRCRIHGAFIAVAARAKTWRKLDSAAEVSGLPCFKLEPLAAPTREEGPGDRRAPRAFRPGLWCQRRFRGGTSKAV
jgi:hypothetical protein